MRIWIASFIPKLINDYTQTVPDGSGRTMIPGPPLTGCFLTDQRSFSNSPTASSRTRSAITVNMANMTLQSHVPHCDNTIEVDCSTGQVTCDKSPDSSRLKIENVATSVNVLSFTLSGGAGNPCVGAVAPDIDWLILVEIRKQSATTAQIIVKSGSMVEPFPAFEMYATWNGATKTLFTRPPDSGATPWNLIGPPNKPVTGSVSFP